MTTNVRSVLSLIVLGVLCLGVARAEVADGSLDGLPKITVGAAGPKAKKGATAMLHVVRASTDDALLLWEQQGKKILAVTVPAQGFPQLVPLQVGRTRDFFAFVEVAGSTKQWVAIELVPEGVP